MKIVICGLGFGGATIAAGLLRDGHSNAGIDLVSIGPGAS